MLHELSGLGGGRHNKNRTRVASPNWEVCTVFDGYKKWINFHTKVSCLELSDRLAGPHSTLRWSDRPLRQLQELPPAGTRGHKCTLPEPGSVVQSGGPGRGEGRGAPDTPSRVWCRRGHRVPHRDRASSCSDSRSLSNTEQCRSAPARRPGSRSWPGSSPQQGGSSSPSLSWTPGGGGTCVCGPPSPQQHWTTEYFRRPWPETKNYKRR